MSGRELVTLFIAVGGLANQGVLAALWYNSMDLSESEFEVTYVLRESELNGPNWCLIIRAENDLRLEGATVLELVIVTWAFKEEMTALAQVVLAYTSAGETYAIMFHSDNPFGSYEHFVANGVYDLGAEEFGTVCFAQANPGMLSNRFCGKPGGIIFDLTAGSECTDATICMHLDEDIFERDPNCRDLLTPADTCDVRGSCTYETGNTDVVNFQFEFWARGVAFDSFEAVGADGERGEDKCKLDSTVSTNGYTITKVWTILDIDDCSQGYDPVMGIYTFYIRNYDSNEEATPTHDGNQIDKDGTRLWEIFCRPGDLVAEQNLQFTETGEIDATTVRSPTRTSTFEVTNMLDYRKFGHAAFVAAAYVDIGTPLYLKICFNPGNPFSPNASPYGIHGIDCMVGNTPDFSDRTMGIIKNGCPLPNDKAFRTPLQFITWDDADGSEFCITTGVIFAAKWATFPDIFFRCSVGLCYNTEYFRSSTCKKSCDGDGVDQPARRKKREYENDDTPLVMTAHLRVSDTSVAESSKMCVDETLAYTVSAVLLAFLLAATAIAVSMFVRLQSVRKRKKSTA